MLRALRLLRKSTRRECRRRHAPGAERRRARAPLAHLAPGRAPDCGPPRARGPAALRAARRRSPPAPGVPSRRGMVSTRWNGMESTTRRLLLEMTNDISPHWLELLTDALTRLSDRLRSCPSVCRASLGVRRAGGRPRQNLSTRLTTFLQGALRAGQQGRFARRSQTESRSTTLTNFRRRWLLASPAH